MAWSLSARNGFNHAVSAEPVAMANTSIVYSDVITADLSAKVVVIDLEVTTAGANVQPDLQLQVSLDGTNFVNSGATITQCSAVNATGHNVRFVDCSSYRAPYYRIAFNTDGTAAGTDGRIKFHFAVR